MNFETKKLKVYLKEMKIRRYQKKGAEQYCSKESTVTNIKDRFFEDEARSVYEVNPEDGKGQEDRKESGFNCAQKIENKTNQSAKRKS